MNATKGGGVARRDGADWKNNVESFERINFRPLSNNFECGRFEYSQDELLSFTILVFGDAERKIRMR